MVTVRVVGAVKAWEHGSAGQRPVGGVGGGGVGGRKLVRHALAAF